MMAIKSQNNKNNNKTKSNKQTKIYKRTEKQNSLNTFFPILVTKKHGIYVKNKWPNVAVHMTRLGLAAHERIFKKQKYLWNVDP